MPSPQLGMADRPAQRPRPSLLIALCIAAAACGEPSAGGQTGDPGVVGDPQIDREPDYVSLEPSVGTGTRLRATLDACPCAFP